MKFSYMLKSFFKVETLDGNNLQVISWWELKRLALNIVWILLSLSILKYFGISIPKIQLGTGAYFIFLLFVLIWIVLNALLTIAWLIELLIKRSLQYGPRILKVICILSLISYLSVALGILFYR